jgi:hypothetical protein
VEISFLALFIIFAAVIGSTAMMGTIAYLLHRIRRIEGGALGGTGSPMLLDQVNELREDVFAVQEGLSSMAERLDFTEKLLMSGDDETGSDLPG